MFTCGDLDCITYQILLELNPLFVQFHVTFELLHSHVDRRRSQTQDLWSRDCWSRKVKFTHDIVIGVVLAGVMRFIEDQQSETAEIDIGVPQCIQKNLSWTSNNPMKNR